MAALAIPIVVLGSLYILSEQEKKTENFQEVIQEEIQKEKFKSGDQNGQVRENFSNYETNKIQDMNKQVINSVNTYSNSNQHTDKFFSPTTNTSLQPNDLKTNKVNLMSGQEVDKTTFKHNNMQPYFGAKIRGASSDLNNTESFLDMKQGYGSQAFSKSEQAPLFKPDENVNLAHGMANNTAFIQSRMNESMKMSNVTLWEPQRVAPGLGLGYGSQNESGMNVGGVEGKEGFNSGMMARDSWMPKNVDQLRVDNNPRQTFDLNGHQGPANSNIKMQGSIGKVEKHLPDKFYNSGPNRWFTTTGAETAPPIRSTQVIPMENRIDTTREYYGAGSNTQSGQAGYTYADVQYEDTKRQDLGQLPVSNASATGSNFAGPNDYSVKSYNLLPNNRTTDKDSVEMGGIYGMAKAAIAPLLDILKPSRKENVIGNLRESGNVNGGPRTGHIFNDRDKTKVTNREMQTDKLGMNHVNVQAGNHRTAYQVSAQQPVQNQRDTTNQEYIGAGASSGVGLRPYNAAYAQQNNVNKTYESRPNQGNMGLFNNSNNLDMKRDESIFKNNRQQLPTSGANMIPSTEFIGETNGPAGYDMTFDSNRLDPNLLTSFKNNPYTQSLSSVA